MQRVCLVAVMVPTCCSAVRTTALRVDQGQSTMCSFGCMPLAGSQGSGDFERRDPTTYGAEQCVELSSYFKLFDAEADRAENQRFSEVEKRAKSLREANQQLANHVVYEQVAEALSSERKWAEAKVAYDFALGDLIKNKQPSMIRVRARIHQQIGLCLFFNQEYEASSLAFKRAQDTYKQVPENTHAFHEENAAPGEKYSRNDKQVTEGLSMCKEMQTICERMQNSNDSTDGAEKLWEVHVAAADFLRKHGMPRLAEVYYNQANEVCPEEDQARFFQHLLAIRESLVKNQQDKQQASASRIGITNENDESQVNQIV